MPRRGRTEQLYRTLQPTPDHGRHRCRVHLLSEGSDCVECNHRRRSRKAGDGPEEELRVRETQALRLEHEACVPPGRSRIKPCRILLGEQQEELERVGEAEPTEFACRRFG